MTLVVGLKYDNGTILATDTRVVVGDIKRDGVAKIDFLSQDIGVASCGLTGATNDIIARTQKCSISPGASRFESAVSALSDEALKWYKENSEKIDEDDDGYSFIMASASNLKKVFLKGYGEDIKDYDCMGSGNPYGQYILHNAYIPNLNEEHATELAAYTIIETSKVDHNVCDQFDIAIFRTDGANKVLNAEEREQLKLRLAPLSRRFIEHQIKRVEEIVEYRENINALWDNKFKFKLFLPVERAILQMMKPCRNGEEFTNNIGSLALLLDQMDSKRMNEISPSEKTGAINILENFLASNSISVPTDFIANFRDIVRLRSAKFPFHKAEAEFVTAVVRVSGEYPPNWSRLYMKALDMYAENLSQLLRSLNEIRSTE